MRYFIFGGNGFVGRHLVERLLNRGDAVTVCDIQDNLDVRINYKGCNYEMVDIRNLSDISNLAISQDDIIINLAANQYHSKVPSNRYAFFHDTNTIGTDNILNIALRKGCTRYLMFSTDMTYGKPQYLPLDVKHPQNPFGPYGQSKKESEDICRSYREKGVNITIFRPRLIIGPGRYGILAKLFKLIDYNLPVPMVGNGKNHYQMISVFDCVEAIICAIEKGVPNKEYNLGSSNAPNVKSLLLGVIKNAGKHSIVVPTPRKLVKKVLGLLDKCGLTLMYPEQYMIADEDYYLDISDTKKDLGWSPKYNDLEMMIEAYQAYKKNGNEKKS